MLRIATVLAALALGSTAQAQQITMVMQTGHCQTYSIAGENNDCQAMLYMMFYQTGRSAFNFATPNGALMLSGGRDSQLTLERYVLEIDTIRMTENDFTRNYDATGLCEMNVAADGSVVHTLVCSASTGLQDIEIVFRGDGSPVSVSEQ